MKILTFSDWSVQSINSIFEFIKSYCKFNRCKIDLIIYCGDDINRFKNKDINYFTELAKLTALKKVCAVIGNNEHYSVKKILKGENIIDEREYVIHEIVFIGQEGANGIGLVTYPEKEIRLRLNKKAKKHKRKFRILVSHTPPKDILDYSIRYSNTNIGSSAIRELINKKSFDLVLCGHSHLNGGRKYILNNGCKIINIASNDKKYSPGRFCVIDIVNREVKGEFLETDFIYLNHELYKLQQVSIKRVKKMILYGINSLKDINESKRTLLKKIDKGVGDWHINRWILQARTIINQTPIVNRDLLIKEISQEYILYDIETDLSQKKIFMIGVFNSSTKRFKQFFEKNNITKLLKRFFNYIKQYPNHRLVSFSNCKLEKRAIENISKQIGLIELKEAMKRDYDLGTPIPDILIGDFKYNLKKLSQALGFKPNTNLGGYEVGNLYSNYLSTGQEPNWKQIKKYNKDDVMALKHIITYILHYKP